MKYYDTKPPNRMCKCGKGWLNITINLTEDDLFQYRYDACDICLNEVNRENSKEHSALQRFNESSVGRKYADCNLFQVNQHATKAMEGSAYLQGPIGSGKTYAAIAKFKDDLSHNRHAMFVSMNDLLTRIKASFKPKPTEYESDLIELFGSVPHLYLDDLGSDKITDFVASTMYAIIDKRYRNDLRTVITSNLSVQELESYIGDRITSRIVSLCQIVKMNGKDKRLAARK